MTKSLIITFEETEESFLMSLLKKYKIAFMPSPVVVPMPIFDDGDTNGDYEPPPTRAEIKAGLMESAKEVAAAIRGEIKLRSAWDLLAEIEAEQKTVAVLFTTNRNGRIFQMKIWMILWILSIQ